MNSLRSSRRVYEAPTAPLDAYLGGNEMKTRQRFSLAENTRHKGATGIIALGALVLMLGGLAACGQNGQQGQGAQQQNQSSQVQGQTQDQASRRNQKQEGQQRPAQSMRQND